MTDGRGVRLPVLVVSAYPALRAGLLSLLASDPQLDPIAAEAAELGGDSGSAPAAIVVDYSAGEPEEFLATAETFPGTPLVLIGADPATDGPGLSGTPVAYLPSDVDALGARRSGPSRRGRSYRARSDRCWGDGSPCSFADQ